MLPHLYPYLNVYHLILDDCVNQTSLVQPDVGAVAFPRFSSLEEVTGSEKLGKCVHFVGTDGLFGYHLVSKGPLSSYYVATSHPP